MQQERRELRRIAFERPARILIRGGEKRSVKSHDFSMEGAAFISKEPIEMGEVLRMTLNVGHSGQSCITRLYGQVVHRSKKDSHFFIGISFQVNKSP